ncbi:hypothetical protein NDU88_001065 [Pleurodeles waltl]|uniref:Uncharacterized protein n=1 Tax=Pleurodeles waltl TaxID=8319 RepID=A0AAV7SY79_PLEWA|nr:hypothetical protein NDU88_000981 [Pleurodeles waltl]KAJ1169159.1 hypothetical protein NDU88_001065 [Pleurodeles waltl]
MAAQREHASHFASGQRSGSRAERRSVSGPVILDTLGRAWNLVGTGVPAWGAWNLDDTGVPGIDVKLGGFHGR